MAATSHSNLTMITGGAWSGKSAWATGQWSAYNDVIHIGTGLRTDPRLDSHIQTLIDARPKSWTHIEEPFHVGETLYQYKDRGIPILIDSASQMITNIAVQSSSKYAPDQLFDHLTASAEVLLDTIASAARVNKILLVTAETGWSPAPESPMQWAVRRAIGVMNQHLATMAGSVFVLCCGIEKKLK